MHGNFISGVDYILFHFFCRKASFILCFLYKAAVYIKCAFKTVAVNCFGELYVVPAAVIIALCDSLRLTTGKSQKFIIHFYTLLSFIYSFKFPLYKRSGPCAYRCASDEYCNNLATAVLSEKASNFIMLIPLCSYSNFAK